MPQRRGRVTRLTPVGRPLRSCRHERSSHLPPPPASPACPSWCPCSTRSGTWRRRWPGCSASGTTARSRSCSRSARASTRPTTSPRGWLLRTRACAWSRTPPAGRRPVSTPPSPPRPTTSWSAVDGHALVPDDYVAVAVDVLERTGADNVGGMMAAEGTTPFERAVAAAMTSRLGVGSASFHVGGEEGEALTVYLGAFRRSALERVGGYDESMVRAQDWEMNHRIRESGGLIWFTPRHAGHLPPPQHGEGARPAVPRVRPLEARGGTSLPRHAQPALPRGAGRRGRRRDGDGRGAGRRRRVRRRGSRWAGWLPPGTPRS